jgi:dihydropyrimidinase
VKGNAKHVFSRGELVVEDGRWVGDTGRGRFVRREVASSNL